MLRKIKKFFRDLKRPKCKNGYMCPWCSYSYSCYADNKVQWYGCSINAK